MVRYSQANGEVRIKDEILLTADGKFDDAMFDSVFGEYRLQITSSSSKHSCQPSTSNEKNVDPGKCSSRCWPKRRGWWDRSRGCKSKWRGTRKERSLKPLLRGSSHFIRWWKFAILLLGSNRFWSDCKTVFGFKKGTEKVCPAPKKGGFAPPRENTKTCGVQRGKVDINPLKLDGNYKEGTNFFW